MDFLLILLVVSIIVVGFIFRDFKSVVYFIGIVEIFFRIVNKLASLLNVKVFSDFVTTYIPNSLESIINYYSSGILNIVLTWILLFLFIYFLWYLVIYWIKKKK